MPTYSLPAHLPEWVGAAEYAERVDMGALKAAAEAFVDLLFTDDAELLDSLPEDFETSVVPIVGVLAAVLEESGSDAEVVVAGRMVRRCVDRHAAQCPPDLFRASRKLPE